MRVIVQIVFPEIQYPIIHLPFPLNLWGPMKVTVKLEMLIIVNFRFKSINNFKNIYVGELR